MGLCKIALKAVNFLEKFDDVGSSWHAMRRSRKFSQGGVQLQTRVGPASDQGGSLKYVTSA